MCRPRASPMAAIMGAESDATARPATGVFQTLVAGKIGHDGAPGSVGAPAGSTGGGGGGGGGTGGVTGTVGWLDALSGLVPARYSAPSLQPSWSVSATLGFVPS